MYKWYKDRTKVLDNRLRLKVGHVQVMRMQHEKFGQTPKEIAKHYKKSYNWNYRLIESILDYNLWPEIKPLGSH